MVYCAQKKNHENASSILQVISKNVEKYYEKFKEQDGSNAGNHNNNTHYLALCKEKYYAHNFLLKL